MSTTAGVFSETTLLNIRAMASARGMDGRTKLNIAAQTAVANIIPKVQTANVSELKSSTKDYTLEIEWPNNCAIVAEDCEACATGGPELSTNTTTYKLTHCVQAPFSHKMTNSIENDFGAQEMIAYGLLSADKVLSEELAHRFLDWLVTNAGVAGWPPNEATGIGTNNGNTVEIATADFTIAAVGYMMKALQYDRISLTNNISGNQLFNAYQNVAFTEGMIPDGIGTTQRVNQFPILFDLATFTAAGYNDRIISINEGAIAFASKSYYGMTPTSVGSDTMVWSEPSKFFPGAILEIWDKITCASDLINHDFNVKIRYEFIMNPAGCDEDSNGVIQFVQV